MIEIENLGKVFARKGKKESALYWAVKNLFLSIGEGEIFGLLGPNGAGKTTTIRMLTMQTKPTEGEIRYGGKKLCTGEQALKTRIGVVPQHINFDQDLTVEENLELHGRLYHMEKEARRARIDELLGYVELAEVRRENTRKLSGGMKRRLLIARALMHHPKILFLDEPTVALDPQVRRRIWGLVRDMAKSGCTVFLTTHYIEEAESLCDRVAILNKGSLVALDTPTNFCETLGKFTVEWDGEGREYKAFPTRREAAAFASDLEHGGAVLIRRTNLEDVFIALTGKRGGF